MFPDHLQNPKSLSEVDNDYQQLFAMNSRLRNCRLARVDSRCTLSQVAYLEANPLPAGDRVADRTGMTGTQQAQPPSFMRSQRNWRRPHIKELVRRYRHIHPEYCHPGHCVMATRDALHGSRYWQNVGPGRVQRQAKPPIQARRPRHSPNMQAKPLVMSTNGVYPGETREQNDV